jgi:hypothetical protein
MMARQWQVSLFIREESHTQSEREREEIQGNKI